MKIGEARRKVFSKLFVNFSGIIFGILVISPFASRKALDFWSLILSGMLLVGTMWVAIFSEPLKEVKE